MVSAGEALMRIVPSDDALEVTAPVSNRDIGFVAAGQEVVVKLDAFNYLRYGTLHGTVVGLSADAVDSTAAAHSGATAGAAGAAAQPGQNPQAPPSDTARIALDTDSIAVDGRPVRPTPGMTVTVDVRTGRTAVDRVRAAAGAALCERGAKGEVSHNRPCDAVGVPNAF
ncbi:HlyD family efflux transporter periplasmic adaptor subunit [Thalassobaculum sp.]|uniref:HlyD family efflux transporter periplasmic adaptor subunit n=1 Tax=Thalassobaculum sp. TaxID=2022740 RepID=UPI0032EB8B51